MNDESKKDAAKPLVLIAGYSALASFGIAVLAFLLLHQISDAGMWAVAAMVAAPSVMGCGIAYYACKQSREDRSSTKP